MSNAVATEIPLSRIELRKIEFRDKITHAALKLFEQQGVTDTSIASIIKEANIAHKTFFNHFPTKDHLLLHIANTFSGNAYAIFREGLKQQTDPKQRIDYCLINIAKTLEDVHPHYKELLNFYLISGAGSGDLRQSQKEQFSHIIFKIINDAKQQNVLCPSSSVETITEIIVGICVTTLLNWSLEKDFPLVSKMKDAIQFINNSVFIDT